MAAVNPSWTGCTGPVPKSGSSSLVSAAPKWLTWTPTTPSTWAQTTKRSTTTASRRPAQLSAITWRSMTQWWSRSIWTIPSPAISVSKLCRWWGRCLAWSMPFLYRGAVRKRPGNRSLILSRSDRQLLKRPPSSHPSSSFLRVELPMADTCWNSKEAHF